MKTARKAIDFAVLVLSLLERKDHAQGSGALAHWHEKRPVGLSVQVHTGMAMLGVIDS